MNGGETRPASGVEGRGYSHPPAGELVDSLKEDGDKIIAALDELLTR